MSELIYISCVVRHLLTVPFYSRECDGSVMVPRYQVYTNGYVTFGLNFESRYPDKFSKYMLSENKRITAQKQGFAMLAPMWTDTFGRFGHVYYQIYDMTKPGSTSTVQTRVKACISLFIWSSFHSLNLTIEVCLIWPYIAVIVTIHRPLIYPHLKQRNTYFFNSIQFNSIQFNSIQFNSIQFNSIQFNSIQFNSIQFNSIQMAEEA